MIDTLNININIFLITNNNQHMPLYMLIAPVYYIQAMKWVDLILFLELNKLCWHKH